MLNSKLLSSSLFMDNTGQYLATVMGIRNFEF